MVDLRTRYMGLHLRSPLVASASPLTGSLDNLRRLEAAGAAAVVLPSLFEEQLTQEAREVGRLLEAGAESLSAAVALDVYYVSSSPGLSGSDVEQRYLDLVRAVRRTIGIPLAVKLSPYFSSVANLSRQLVEAGAQALVLFNRFYQPDLDLDSLEVTPHLVLSSSEELRLPLRWIAILAGHVPASLAASPGVHPAEDAVKVLMAGADVAMMTSALLRHGPEHLTVVETGLRNWLEGRGMPSVDLLRGLRSQRSVRDPAAWERANYVTMLASYPDQVHTQAR